MPVQERKKSNRKKPSAYQPTLGNERVGKRIQGLDGRSQVAFGAAATTTGHSPPRRQESLFHHKLGAVKGFGKRDAVGCQAVQLLAKGNFANGVQRELKEQVLQIDDCTTRGGH